MKGFGFSQEKRSLAKAIQKRNLRESEKVLAQLEQKIPNQQVIDLLMEVLSTLSPEDLNWASEHLIPDEVYEEIDEQVTMMLYQMLNDKGFKPGRDFSLKGEGLILTQQAHDTLLPDLPEDYRHTFSSEMVIIQEKSPVEVLEQQLGVPFIDNLLQRINQRFPTLTDRQASRYLYNICIGVEDRTGIPMMEILIASFGEDEQFSRVFNLIDQGESIENSDSIYDLVASAGGEAELTPDSANPSGYRLSHRAIELLDTVYQGKRPIDPLLQAMDEPDEDA